MFLPVRFQLLSIYYYILIFYSHGLTPASATLNPSTTGFQLEALWQSTISDSINQTENSFLFRSVYLLQLILKKKKRKANAVTYCMSFTINAF